jgi:hypothetical protein
MRSAQLICKNVETAWDVSGTQSHPVLLAEQQNLLRSDREGRRPGTALLVHVSSHRRVVCTQTNRPALQKRKKRADGAEDCHHLEIVHMEKRLLDGPQPGNHMYPRMPPPNLDRKHP